VLDVYEVRVRPKDDRQPRAVAAVYIDRETGEVVRMTFSFTRAALIDKESGRCVGRSSRTRSSTVAFGCRAARKSRFDAPARGSIIRLEASFAAMGDLLLRN